MNKMTFNVLISMLEEKDIEIIEISDIAKRDYNEKTVIAVVEDHKIHVIGEILSLSKSG